MCAATAALNVGGYPNCAQKASVGAYGTLKSCLRSECGIKEHYRKGVFTYF